MAETTHLQLEIFPADEWNVKKFRDFVVGLAGDSSSSNMQKIDAAIRNLQINKADLIDGLIPAAELPSYVDDVIEGTVSSDFTSFTLSGDEQPCIPESGKIYVDVGKNITYRWSGSLYVPVGSDLALGETASTAYRGDRGKIAYDHTTASNNPHNVTKDQIGLNNVDNTSDANKPISTAQQAAFDAIKNTLGDVASLLDELNGEVI